MRFRPNMPLGRATFLDKAKINHSGWGTRYALLLLGNLRPVTSCGTGSKIT